MLVNCCFCALIRYINYQCAPKCAPRLLALDYANAHHSMQSAKDLRAVIRDARAPNNFANAVTRSHHRGRLLVSLSSLFLDMFVLGSRSVGPEPEGKQLPDVYLNVAWVSWGPPQ